MSTETSTVSESPSVASADATRAEVARAYTAAIGRYTDGSEKPTEPACCGPSACAPDKVALDEAGGEPRPVGVAACTAGYGAEVKDLPPGVAESTFGCGNPLAFAGVEAGQVVLDLGSGAGLDLLLAAKKVGPEGRVIGVDMTDAMIETARRNIAAAGATNVELRKGLIEDLPVADGSVDWVISNCVINLSPEKPAVFREIARVLAPGGRFSISDIVAEELPDVIRDQAIAYAACVGGAISEARYLAGLEAAGLTELEVTERQVYGESQLRGIVASDLADFGLTESSPEAAELLGQVEKVAGKVWSAKITGRKPT